MAERFSQLERNILQYVITRANCPAREVAEALKVKDHQVHYSLRKFKSSGLISRRVMVDVYKLGYSRHTLFFSLTPEGQKRRSTIVKAVVESEFTSVMLELGGEYDYFFQLVVRELSDLVHFIHWLTEQYGDLFSKKSFGVQAEHFVFGEKLISDTPVEPNACSYQLADEHFEFDETDHKILSAVMSPEVSSAREIARQTGLAPTTLDYRLKNLQKSEIISGETWEVNGQMLGLSNFLMLISVAGLEPNIHSEIFEYAKASPVVAHYSYVIGDWDYVLGVAVQDKSDATRLVEELHNRFESKISNVRLVPMFKAHKVVDYPLTQFKPTRVPRKTMSEDKLAANL